MRPVQAGELELQPPLPADAAAWQRLLAGGPGPLGDGIAASPLGGRATNRTQWVQNCLDLRAQAARNMAFPYLVRVDGELAGEALGFIDYGTAAVEVLVWLGAPFATSARLAACVDLLGVHLLTAPASPERVLTYVDVTDAAALEALAERGYAHEGDFRDPPRADRAVLVRHRPHPGPTGSADAGESAATGPETRDPDKAAAKPAKPPL